MKIIYSDYQLSFFIILLLVKQNIISLLILKYIITFNHFFKNYINLYFFLKLFKFLNIFKTIIK